MNGIALTEYQKELVDYALPHCEEHWHVDGDGITEMIAYHDEDTDEPLPRSWTLPKVEYGELVLSDFSYVNNTLREWIIRAKWLKRSYNALTRYQTKYQKDKWSKACKDLIYKIDGETMFKT